MSSDHFKKKINQKIADIEEQIEEVQEKVPTSNGQKEQLKEAQDIEFRLKSIKEEIRELDNIGTEARKQFEKNVSGLADEIDENFKSLKMSL